MLLQDDVVISCAGGQNYHTVENLMDSNKMVINKRGQSKLHQYSGNNSQTSSAGLSETPLEKRIHVQIKYNSGSMLHPLYILEVSIQDL